MTESKNKEVQNDECICFKPIGIVRNRSQDASWGETLQALPWEERAARMREQTRGISEIIINPELADGLDRIEEYSHLQVLYYPHLVPEERRTKPVLKVRPLGSRHFPLVGVLATRSPIRPNSILVTTVRLLKRNGTILEVSGLDALDGSPVLDIKPGMAEQTDGAPMTIPDWMKQVNEQFISENTTAPGTK